MSQGNPKNIEVHGRSCQVWTEEVGSRWYWRFTLQSDPITLHEDKDGKANEGWALEAGVKAAEERAAKLTG